MLGQSWHHPLPTAPRPAVLRLDPRSQQAHCLERQPRPSWPPVPKGCLVLGLLSRVPPAPALRAQPGLQPPGFWAIH